MVEGIKGKKSIYLYTVLTRFVGLLKGEGCYISHFLLNNSYSCLSPYFCFADVPGPMRSQRRLFHTSLGIKCQDVLCKPPSAAEKHLFLTLNCRKHFCKPPSGAENTFDPNAYTQLNPTRSHSSRQKTCCDLKHVAELRRFAI